MIRMLPNETKINLQESVSTQVHAYNCTHQTATWFSPYFLLYGRHPMLHRYSVQHQDISVTSTHNYVNKLCARYVWAYRKAHEAKQKEIQHSKICYDKNAKCSKLQPGDLVLVRQKAFKGKHKIKDRWEIHPIMF